MESPRVADDGLRRALVAMVRGRVPPHEVDEIVQETLTDAFASKSAPTDAEALERWIRGIARHKVADYHRRAKREITVEPDSLAGAHASDHGAHEAADLLRWAEKESKRDGTLEWLLREGDGEKLQTIAREERVPAATVRQRVARLRRHFRARWAAQIAAVIAVGVLALLVLRPRPKQPELPVAAPSVPSVSSLPSVAPSVVPPPNPAIELRRFALQLCEKKAWDACIDGLDRAAVLDPDGEKTSAVESARKAAAEARKPPPAPTPSPTTFITKKPTAPKATKSDNAVGF